jgi:hypothetical protein
VSALIFCFGYTGFFLFTYLLILWTFACAFCFNFSNNCTISLAFVTLYFWKTFLLFMFSMILSEPLHHSASITVAIAYTECPKNRTANRQITNRHALLIPESFLCSQPAGCASKPKLSTSSWWSRGNAQWDVQQMTVGWRASQTP